MSAFDPRLKRWLAWIAPFAVLALLIGLQTGWGSEWRRTLPPDAPAKPAAVAVAVMPEFRIDGGIESMRATVERPLFNATRRPAPTLAGDASKPSIQRGQFVLTGTMIVDNVAIAFLKEAGGTGKSRSVRKGDSINGMVVAAVEPDRVRFSVGDETEELELKVAKGPKTTQQPSGDAAAAPAAAPATGAPGAPVVPPGTRSRAQGGLAGPGAATENVRANRRAARAAEAQPKSPPAMPGNPQAGAQGGAQAGQPAWEPGRYNKK
jgi:hypothetical protein